MYSQFIANIFYTVQVDSLKNLRMIITVNFFFISTLNINLIKLVPKLHVKIHRLIFTPSIHLI